MGNGRRSRKHKRMATIVAFSLMAGCASKSLKNKTHVGYDDLTPAQFKEAQNYMNAPSYQIDKSLGNPHVIALSKKSRKNASIAGLNTKKNTHKITIEQTTESIIPATALDDR